MLETIRTRTCSASLGLVVARSADLRGVAGRGRMAARFARRPRGGGAAPRALAPSQAMCALPEHPVAVFDSGVGGLTVLHELLVSLPTEDFVYLGDTARFPYGERP